MHILNRAKTLAEFNNLWGYFCFKSIKFLLIFMLSFDGCCKTAKLECIYTQFNLFLATVKMWNTKSFHHLWADCSERNDLAWQAVPAAPHNASASLPGLSSSASPCSGRSTRSSPFRPASKRKTWLSCRTTKYYRLKGVKWSPCLPSVPNNLNSRPVHSCTCVCMVAR